MLSRHSSRKHGLISGHFHLRRHKSTRELHPDQTIAHGSQVDIIHRHESQIEPLDASQTAAADHHEDEIVDHLEVIDPMVSTVSILSNTANSIIFPPMELYSRRPVIQLPKSPIESSENQGTDAEMDELDRHIKHVLRKKDNRLKQTALGVWSFLKTPMGIIVGIYGLLVVFWGAALVLFLAGWIPTSSKDRQGFWVEVCSQIVNALFTITGIGLIPWRAIDTYRILRIWHYKRLTRRLRMRTGLPLLYDEDDLPDPIYDENFVHVLTDEQQRHLHYQHVEFAESQTWYIPHGTETHRAFPISTALLICLFIDGNSIAQAILCSCMWSLDRFQRPAWTTGTLIPVSFLCGIVASVLIWWGSHKTKRVEAVENRLRAVLETDEPIQETATSPVTAVGQSQPAPLPTVTPKALVDIDERDDDGVDEKEIDEGSTNLINE
ncbi:hypothetical protein M422DRAFT_238225 [Sphaerobolus stellatus SS14]|nr:hypothetical protein M422DRAFT_238225 [Sphaerobolus stellatus SS14]